MARKFICPRCGQKSGIAILYGNPTMKMIERSDRGDIKLGGCVIEPKQPDRYCSFCQAIWVRKSGVPLNDV